MIEQVMRVQGGTCLHVAFNIFMAILYINFEFFNAALGCYLVWLLSFLRLLHFLPVLHLSHPHPGSMSVTLHSVGFLSGPSELQAYKY